MLLRDTAGSGSVGNCLKGLLFMMDSFWCMSIEDLREILQLSGTSATKMRLKRARDRLRKLYQQEFPDEDEAMEQ